MRKQRVHTRLSLSTLVLVCTSSMLPISRPNWPDLLRWSLARSFRVRTCDRRFPRLLAHKTSARAETELELDRGRDIPPPLTAEDDLSFLRVRFRAPILTGLFTTCPGIGISPESATLAELPFAFVEIDIEERCVFACLLSTMIPSILPPSFSFVTSEIPKQAPLVTDPRSRGATTDAANDRWPLDDEQLVSLVWDCRLWRNAGACRFLFEVLNCTALRLRGESWDIVRALSRSSSWPPELFMWVSSVKQGSTFILTSCSSCLSTLGSAPWLIGLG